MSFHDLPTASIANRFLRLDYLAQAGPRLVRLVMAGSEANLLGELPQAGWETPFGAYHLYGGHRLWHAPEDFPRSSIPDNGGLQAEVLPGGVRLLGELESPTGLRKRMDIALLEDRPAVQIVHTIRNEGQWPVELALWAITILPGGGIAVVEQRRQASGESLQGDHSPDRQIALWPDTSWEDPRFHFLDEALVVESTPGMSPCKLGTYTQAGWLAYQCQGMVFVKRCSPLETARYPDRGCNAEIFCGPDYIELETLSPLLTLQPGQSASHTETWEVYPAPLGSNTVLPGGGPALAVASGLQQTAAAISRLADPASRP
jgi:hypothetical protein